MLTNYYIEKRFHLEEGSVSFVETIENFTYVHIELPPKKQKCPFCKSYHTNVKDYRMQKILLTRDLDIPIYAMYRKRRYKCCSCGHSFAEKTALVGKYQRQSRQYQKALLYACTTVKSFTQIAREFFVSPSTVARCFMRISMPKPKALPLALGIDEFKGNAWGQKYQVILTDSENGSIIDILKRRDTKELLTYFASFSRAERARVKYITMDLSRQFRSIVERMFPHATIVADRFHITRLVMWALENVRKREQNTHPELRSYFKRSKSLLRKKRVSLTAEDSYRVSTLLQKSTPIQQAYLFKETFLEIMKLTKKSELERHITYWLTQVKKSKLPEFQSLLRTFSDWKLPIENGIQKPLSNGFTEGCNNKIKVLKRTCYGIKNFNLLRNRILFIGVEGRKKKTT